jgi:GH24 family phage-related lysozyme (muramidase)
MSDVVPKEGYTTLPEAVKRVAAGLADRHVFLNKNQRLLAHELGLSLKSKRRATKSRKLSIPMAIPKRKRQKQRHMLRQATLAWDKRQLAVWKLYEALQNDALVSFVRDPASGEMFRITANDWHGAAFWRDTIIGGEVRALPGELIERYNNRLVLIETPALEAWLATAKEPTTSPAVAERLAGK